MTSRSEAGPGDRPSFDLLRWSPGLGGGVPDAEALVPELYGSADPEPEASTLGDFLCSGSEDDRVATGTTGSGPWIADRHLLPLRPRTGPWRGLRAEAAEVHRVAWTEVLGASVWEHWRRGRRIREVALGLTDRPVVRGRLQPFEEGWWDGTVPDPGAEPLLQAVPPEEAYDVEALIAAEPPGSVRVDPEGNRLLTITTFPRDPDDPYAPDLPDDRRIGSGFTSEGEVFINLDTINLRQVVDGGGAGWPDQDALVAAALAEWFGLAGPICSWDWPCQVWRVRG